LKNSTSIEQTMSANVLIRAIGEDERDAWNPLWAGYLTFYGSTLAQDISDTAWARFHDPNEPLFALGGYVDGELLGFAHYLFHRSTWARNRYCYLEDLFVSEEARNRGLGRALIEEVYRKAQSAGASRVYWLTQSSNAQARALYDNVADNLGFIQYRKVL
jgi:GNAT superfamily N-acetyltransferase